MKVNITPNGVLQIDDANITFRNFGGAPDKYHKLGGARSFAVLIPDANVAKQLVEAGWNVKNINFDDGYSPFLTVKVNYGSNNVPPKVYLQTSGIINPLSAESIGMLDRIEISSVSMDIAPYPYNVNGKIGISAYLRAMKVIQSVDRFEAQEIDRFAAQNQNTVTQTAPLAQGYEFREDSGYEQPPSASLPKQKETVETESTAGTWTAGGGLDDSAPVSAPITNTPSETYTAEDDYPF